MMTHQIASTQRTRVVIVGAGFGGLAATEQMGHLPVDITLVDMHDYHTFTRCFTRSRPPSSMPRMSDDRCAT